MNINRTRNKKQGGVKDNKSWAEITSLYSRLVTIITSLYSSYVANMLWLLKLMNMLCLDSNSYY